MPERPEPLPPLTIGGLVREATERLKALPQAEPRLEAELLLMATTGATRAGLIAWPERTLDPEQVDCYQALVVRRLSGEPIAHIRGRQAFWSQELRITPDTLIPRPETELLVEIALELLLADAPLLIVDAGTGSGAIALALALERPAWTLIAMDLSPGAVAVAADNLARHEAANAWVVRADWLAPLAPASLDALIANPPYIPATDPHLRQGDLPREPLSALASGADGLDGLRRITRQAAQCLKPGGLLALEHGFDQDAAVRVLLAAVGFERLETRPDLAGHPRATLGYRPGNS
ncbi:MAG: peptide chain release factor N(5)-glutamine methyltransferase [Chromatiaceae bacterium]|nr:peptide chain release factor N(5)-glutamine methyltransferase [Chromatiaceae bacterium]